MTPLSFNFTLGLLGAIMAVPMLVLGTVFIKMGHWPRRRGSEPHCRKCDYLLVGIASERCPECGGNVGPALDLRGSRRRNWGMTLTGSAFSLLGLASLVPMSTHLYRSVDWYRRKPTFLVMRDLDSKVMPTAMRAFRELNRRHMTTGLAEEYRIRIVDKALTEQAATATSPLTSPLLDFVAAEFDAGRLDEPRSERFLHQCYRVRLQIGFTSLGQQVFLSSWCEGRLPSLWSADVTSCSLKLDEQTVYPSFGPSGFVASVSTASWAYGPLPCDKVGPHEVLVEWSAVIHRGLIRHSITLPPPVPIREVNGRSTLRFEIAPGPATSATVPIDLTK